MGIGPEEKNMTLSQKKSYYIARLLEIVIGAYFIAGALPKILDVDKFVIQMAAYKVIESPALLEPAVLFTISLEICLGMFLLLGLRLKGLTLVALQGLIIFFTILIAYAWRVHGLEDCGCFPVFKMSPPVSIAKNVFILASSAYICWRLILPGPDSGQGLKSFLARLASKNLTGEVFTRRKIAAFLLSISLGLASSVYACKTLDREALLNKTTNDDGIFRQFELFMNEGYFNLGEGVHLVPVMSASCPECKEKVPELNDLFVNPELPKMVALCYEEVPGELDEFRALTAPIFPIHSLGDRSLLYFSLIEKEPFRLVLVEDGKAIDSWDGFVPDADVILDSLQSLPKF